MIHAEHRARFVTIRATAILIIAAGAASTWGCSVADLSVSLAQDTRDVSFPDLSASPHPTQHANPRRSDYIEHPAPTRVEKKWEALTDSMIAQPCASGTGNQIYCTRAWEPASGRCNLVALDADDGAVLWMDEVDGSCLLDELAWMSVPLVDVEGNVYAADSRGVASFTSAGKLRWYNQLFGELTSRKNLPNVAFGLNMTPEGDLVMATMADGWLLVVDRDSGRLVMPAFDLPSAKFALSRPQPPGFMDQLASPTAAKVLWEISVGASPYEVDNDLAVDPESGLFFVAAGGPAPNHENIGALWAVEVVDGAMQVAFYVPMKSGKGGSGTTPTVTADGQFVLVGDNANNLMAIDIAACRKVAKGAACEAALRVPFDGQLGASFVATPDNRIFVSAAGVHAFDLSRDADGNLIAEHRWTHDTIPLVITGFENIVYFPSREGHLVGLDPDNGQVLFDQPGGLGANVTMASDLRTLITNQINFGQKPPAGVWGWRTPD